MIKDYSFKDIEKYLKKDSEVGNEILDAFNSLADAAIIFTPIVLGPQFLPLLELLDVKDRLFDLGNKVYNYISKKIETDYIDRISQIEAAYALICYTAYFDVFQDALPKKVQKELKLKLENKNKLIKESAENSDILQLRTSTCDIHCNLFYADHVTSFPQIKKQLETIYSEITHRIIKMIAETGIYDTEKSEDRQIFENLKEQLKNLPNKAIEAYEAQYLKLSDQFNDFALFAQMKNFEGIEHSIEKNAYAIKILSNMTQKIDVGLNNLNNLVSSIVTNFSTIQVQDIVNDLRDRYRSIIEEPIIDDKEITPDNQTMNLRFPKITDAFIPQSYKCLSYQKKDIKLEDTSVWNNLPTNNDLDKFFIRYLYSPDSIEYPLIILGHPGSGKSLLTKVLSAQLMSESYTVVRIPLREVNAESGIDVLVEDQIKKLTNRPLSVQGYGGFASQFSEKPLTIILDGYDELLQAKGDVFSGYLEKARTFQQDQKSMNRPVRIIITSRITLIDKARIPINSTILRLMEFDQKQRQTWINIWNTTNTQYFSNNSIQPFKLLDSNDKGKKGSIIELAEQPLLLLMLALYDSDSNELAQTNNINRTELYDNLIRRFVRRERSRYVPNFSGKSIKEQEQIIDQEMNRLGVVAIGMYNRQEVVILSRQLEKDLDLYNAHRKDGSPESHTLKESESVLGGFFFIHKSSAHDINENSNNEDSAFEFLHNTFGEFLAADFILRNTIAEVKDIYVDRIYKPSSLEHKFSNPDSLNPAWFYCLMFVPLYSRPVVIEMMREHASKALQRAFETNASKINLAYADFIDNLDFIVQNQLKMILTTRNSPKVMRNGMLFDNDIPLLGYLSIYSLNLIILASTLNPNGFEFNEDEYHNSKSTELESKPWDKLASLWKTWFSPADLAGLSVIIKSERKSNTIVKIICNEKFEAIHYEKPIDVLLCVSSTLADNLLIGLSGLQTQQFCEISRMDDKDICKMLKKENLDLYLSYLIILLRKEVIGFLNSLAEPYFIREKYRIINEIIIEIISDKRICNINCDNLLSFFEVLEYCLQNKLLFFSTRKYISNALSDLIDDSKFNLKKKSESLEIIAAIRLLQLLLPIQDDLILDRKMLYDESIFRNSIISENRNREIDQILRYSHHYTKNRRLVIQDFDCNQIALLDEIENSLIMRSEDKIRLLRQFISPESIDVLLETNPELISRAVLILVEKDKYNKAFHPEIIDYFLEKCIRQLLRVGINCFGYNAIINVLSIVHYVNKKMYLEEICDCLQHQLFSRYPEYFSTVIHFYPNFVVKLIEVVPEIFDNVFPNVLESLFLKRKKWYIDSNNLLDYIKVFRYFYTLADEKYDAKKNISDKFHQITNIIEKYNNLEKMNFNQLNIDQLDDLMWYANLVDNKHISAKIKKLMCQYPNLK